MSGLTAYQYLVDHIELEAGRTVLVNGAAGGVGHFLVQLAKTMGAHVIGVASARHETFLRELGVDRFVAYDREVVQDVVRGVDVLVDAVGGPNGHRLLPVLNRGGRISPVFYGDYHAEEAARRDITVGGGQVHSDGRQLTELAQLMSAGSLHVGIDSVFDLADASKAHERAEQGHIQGKIVLSVRP